MATKSMCEHLTMSKINMALVYNIMLDALETHEKEAIKPLDIDVRD